jgi:cyanophycin synthetase
LRVDGLAVALYGRARHNVANTLAAVAALMALGQCSYEAIVSGVRSFTCSTEKNPLRLNTFSVAGIDVWVDYAHNPAAYLAILHTARAMNFRHIVGVVSAPADRRDAELQLIGRICATELDAMVVYEPDEKRGRPRGETAQVLLESGVAAAQGRISVQVVPDVRDAIWTAYTLCLSGDLLLFGGATKLQDLEIALERGSPAVDLVLEERRPVRDA